MSGVEVKGTEVGLVDVYAKKGDRGGGARLGVLVGVPIYTRFVLAATKGASGRSTREKDEKKMNARRETELTKVKRTG